MISSESASQEQQNGVLHYGSNRFGRVELPQTDEKLPIRCVVLRFEQFRKS